MKNKLYIFLVNVIDCILIAGLLCILVPVSVFALAFFGKDVNSGRNR